MGNAVSRVNSETSRMVAVREPKLRTTANSRTMAEMMASSEEGITYGLFEKWHHFPKKKRWFGVGFCWLVVGPPL